MDFEGLLGAKVYIIYDIFFPACLALKNEAMVENGLAKAMDFSDFYRNNYAYSLESPFSTIAPRFQPGADSLP